MNKTILSVALASALGTFPQVAGAQVFGDVAKVISATPIYEQVTTPRRECRTEQMQGYEERRSARPAPAPATESSGGIGPGTVLGAIVGGVIGHQFGSSSGGRDHGTAAGAVIGGIIGNQADREAEAGYRQASRDVVVDRVPVTRDVERCREVPQTTDRIVGYDVRYEYNGRELRTRMTYDPGPELPVNVEVRPPAARASMYGPRPPAYRGPY